MRGSCAGSLRGDLEDVTERLCHGHKNGRQDLEALERAVHLCGEWKVVAGCQGPDPAADGNDHWKQVIEHSLWTDIDHGQHPGPEINNWRNQSQQQNQALRQPVGWKEQQSLHQGEMTSQWTRGEKKDLHGAARPALALHEESLEAFGGEAEREPFAQISRDVPFA